VHGFAGASRGQRAVTAALLVMGCAAAGRAAATCELGRFDLPVTMQGRWAMVTAGINGHAVRLLADSGTFFSTLSAAGAAELRLSVGAPRTPIFSHSLGGNALASVTTVRTFTLGAATLPNVEFIVGGRGPPGAVGVLGDNVLGLFDTEYDLASGVIRLMRPRGCGDSDLAYWATAQPHSVLDLDWGAQSVAPPRGTAYVNGHSIRVVFDSGASVSLLALRAAERAGVRPGGAGVVAAAAMAGGGSGRIETWIAPFDSFRIGDEEILHTHLRIGDLGLIDTDMLLGADFFRSHHIYLSASQHRAYFTYNGGPVFNLATDPAVK